MRELYSSTFFVSSNTHAISIPKGEESKMGHKKYLKKLWLKIPQVWGKIYKFKQVRNEENLM